MDDICLGATATSIAKLKQILERTTKAILQEAKASAIEFELEKTELLYASRKRDPIQVSIQVGKQTIHPSKLVRWLGFFLDSKFSYREHVQKKVASAQQAFYRLQRLGNTQRGLSMQATRLLYIACVESIADYRTQAW